MRNRSEERDRVVLHSNGQRGVCGGSLTPQTKRRERNRMGRATQETLRGTNGKRQGRHINNKDGS